MADTLGRPVRGSRASGASNGVKTAAAPKSVNKPATRSASTPKRSAALTSEPGAATGQKEAAALMAIADEATPLSPGAPTPETIDVAEPAAPVVMPEAVLEPAIETAQAAVDEAVATPAAATPAAAQAAFTEETVKTLIEVNELVSRGVEGISKELINHSWSAVEQAAAAFSQLISARTLQDVVALNIEFQQRRYDSLLETGSKVGLLGAKLATDAAGPLSARAKSMVLPAQR